MSDQMTRPSAPQQTHAETLEQVAHRFVAYWTKDHSPGGKGCGMCGGIPHSTTCFVGRMEAALRAPVGTCETCQHFKRFEGRAGKTGDGECWNMDNPYCDFAHASFGCIFHSPRPETPQEEK